jgi:hypothetical protein
MGYPSSNRHQRFSAENPSKTYAFQEIVTNKPDSSVLFFKKELLSYRPYGETVMSLQW